MFATTTTTTTINNNNNNNNNNERCVWTKLDSQIYYILFAENDSK